MDRFSRIYARQEYLTPGAAETVDWLAEAARPGPASQLLEVAFGKGEAACTLAARFGCRVVAVDRHSPFVEYTAGKVRERGLTDRVALLRADGRQLPVHDNSFDAAYCIGAPSIVGTEDCLRELRRSVRPGGVVVVSDIVWRQQPSEPLGEEWGWVASYTPRRDVDAYSAVIAASGLAVDRVTIHERAAWDEYHRPMTEVAKEARVSGDDAFATEIDESRALERHAVDAFFDYATFIAHRP